MSRPWICAVCWRISISHCQRSQYLTTVHEPQTAYYLDSISPADIPWVQSLERLSTVTTATLRRLTSVGGVSEIISSMLVVGLRNCNALTELNLLYTIELASLVPFTTFTNLRSITFAKLEPDALDFVAESDSWMTSATSLSFLVSLNARLVA